MKKLENFKKKVNKIADRLENDVYAICETLDYVNSSKFSYNIDRIRELKRAINDFELLKL